MSTTFGVKDNNSEKVFEVAYRGNTGIWYWKADVAKLLPNEIEVIPMDNTAQGIHTIGDIREEIDKYDKFIKERKIR